MRYTESDILLHVGPRALLAGQDYRRRKRILSVKRDDGAIAARVRGSRPSPYGLEIKLAGSDGKVKFRSTCDCPVGSACKHVAAVLLDEFARGGGRSPDRAGAGSAGPSPSKASELPPELATWLNALERVRSEEESDYPKDERQRIIYVLAPETKPGALPRLELRVMSTRLLKDGTLSERAHSFDQRLQSYTHPSHIRPEDRRIFQAVTQARAAGYVYGREGAFSSADSQELLKDIVATGRARWLGVRGVALTLGSTRPAKIIWEIGEDVQTRPRLDVEGGLLALNAAPPVYVDPAAGTIGPLDLGLAPKLAMTLLEAPPTRIEHVASLRDSLAARLPALADWRPPPPPTAKTLDEPPVYVLRLMKGEGPPSYLGRVGPYRYYESLDEPAGVARLIFRYGPVDVPLGEERQTIQTFCEGALIEVRRRIGAEKAAVAELRRSGFERAQKMRPELHAQHRHVFMPNTPGESVWFDLLWREAPRLKEKGWSVEIDEDFPFTLLDGGGDFNASVTESSGVDWLELDLGVVVDGETIDLVKPIVALIGSEDFEPTGLTEGAGEGEPFFLRLADGRRLALPKARLAPIVKAIWELSCGGRTGEGGKLRLSMMDAATLAELEQATRAAGALWRGGEKLREMGRKLTAEGGLPQVELPANFSATLRPYQMLGVRWLSFLRDVGVGGVLADDMGLGKTVQALALIALEKAAGRLTAPVLVIAPTSLMANWRREAEKFAPDLRVIILQGSDRKKRFDEIDAADLVLSTYPLIPRDHEALSAREWSLLLLDEAQTIKNPNAATTKLIRGLKAKNRFCLTGTPLENHLGELWSIFSFALPGFLGDLPTFTHNFRTPIEKKGDAARGRALAGRVKPFLLRRTKEEVANELPPKTEIVERVEMAPAQRDIYESIRLSMHEKVRAAIAQKGFARSRIVILDALLKLRQCCCDPRLLKLSAKTGGKAGSAKLERLSEMLSELLDEGRRVLVFSQFTSMLDLIRPQLDAMRVPYSLLTGDTRDRPKQIEDFQDGRTQLFLISLKAGGVGLNLTAADTVILYDPWWNPAVEDQAIDRAHRIGQEKPVFVHKLVVSGTIEEKMELLKEKKRALAESLFDHDGAPTLAMTEADFEMLFAAEA